MKYQHCLFKNKLNSYKIIEYNKTECEIYSLSWVLLEKEKHDIKTRKRIFNWLLENHPELIL